MLQEERKTRPSLNENVFLSDQGSDTEESPVKKTKSTPGDLSDLSDQENAKLAKRSYHNKRAAGGKGEDE